MEIKFRPRPEESKLFRSESRYKNQWLYMVSGHVFTTRNEAEAYLQGLEKDYDEYIKEQDRK